MYSASPVIYPRRFVDLLERESVSPECCFCFFWVPLTEPGIPEERQMEEHIIVLLGGVGILILVITLKVIQKVIQKDTPEEEKTHHSDEGSSGNLTDCKECGEQVSESASKCPHCGAPAPAKQSNKKKGCLGCLVICFLLVLTIALFATPDEPGNAGEPENSHVSEGSADADKEEKQTSERPNDFESEITPREEDPKYYRNLRIANRLEEKVQEKNLSLNWSEKGAIGTLPKGLKIVQVISSDKALMTVSGYADIPGDFFIMEGVNMTGSADGQRVTTGDTPFEFVGTVTYTTALETTKTVPKVTAVDIAAVRDAVTRRVDELKSDLEARKELPINRVAELKEKLPRYKANIEHSEKAAQRAKEIEEKLKELPDFTDEEIEDQQTEFRLLEEQLRSAEKTAKIIKRKY